MIRNPMRPLIFTSLILIPLALGGCTAAGTVAGVAATTGVAAAQEGGLSRAWGDAQIQAEINDLWFRQSFEIFRKLDLTVNQGRVLITGVVQNPEHRVEAVRLAWKPKGVKQVINEIRVAESEGLTGMARDTWAATRLRTAITLDRDVQSINYNIDIVQGIVYLMGVAQSRAELNRVIETARTIPDIKQVVSYVKLAGEVDQNFQPADSSAPADLGGEITQGESFGVAPVQSEQTYGNESYSDGMDNANQPIPLNRSHIDAIEVETID